MYTGFDVKGEVERPIDTTVTTDGKEMLQTALHYLLHNIEYVLLI